METKHGEIMEKLGLIEGEMRGMRREMKKMNGGITDNRKDITNLKVEDATFKQKIAWLGAGAGLIVSLIVTIVVTSIRELFIK